MKALLPLLSVLALSLLAACSPEPSAPPAQPAPKAAETPPAGAQAREDAREASREAVEAAREAAGKAGEAAKKFGEAGAAAVQAVVESTEEKVREGVEAAAGSEETVRDAKEAAEHAAQRIADATRSQVAAVLWASLLFGLAHAPGLEQMAETLHVNARTLHRALQREGWSFNAMVEEQRRYVAHDLLTVGGVSVSEMAERLGYSEVSNFSRAFRRWYGVSPGRYVVG